MSPTTQVKQAVATTLEAVEEAKKTTGQIGIKQIGNMTPNWAQWMFRIFFYVTQFGTLVLTLVSEIPAETKVKIIFWLSIVVMGVHMFSKMWGIDTKKIQQEAIDALADSQITTKK